MVLMNGSDYIELDSVGSTLTKDLLVFPTDCSEAPETASEAEEMMGVHIMDCTDEWWEGMSMEDMTTLFPFLVLLDQYVSRQLKIQVGKEYKEFLQV